MKLSSNSVLVILVCFAILAAIPFPAAALTDRPVQHDEQGNFVPNPHAEGDALRYGGLFGPLTPPEDPLAFLGVGSQGPELSPRNMGFAVDEGNFIPVNAQVTSD